MTQCKICDGRTELFDVVDRGKTCDLRSAYPLGLHGVPIWFHRCGSCGFIFTPDFDQYTDLQWKSVIYNAEYTQIDPEYAERRPASNARFIEILLARHRFSTIGLDYGGGNGMTTEILRRRGWTFDSHDPFGRSDMNPERWKRYNVATAFEVFEHLPDPFNTLTCILEQMIGDAPLVVIGTSTCDGRVDDVRRLAWWYAAPRNGHISLYSKRSLSVLAERCGLHCVSLLGRFHFLSREAVPRGLLARCVGAMIQVRAERVVRGLSGSR